MLKFKGVTTELLYLLDITEPVVCKSNVMIIIIVITNNIMIVNLYNYKTSYRTYSQKCVSMQITLILFSLNDS